MGKDSSTPMGHFFASPPPPGPPAPLPLPCPMSGPSAEGLGQALLPALSWSRGKYYAENFGGGALSPNNSLQGRRP